MAGEEQVPIKIQVDDADLQAAMLRAAQTTEAAFARIRTAAEQANLALNSPAAANFGQFVTQQLQKQVADWETLKNSIIPITSATQDVAAATEAASGSMRGLNALTSGAVQEYIRLGHEAATGNFSRIPGSLLVLTSRMGGLNGTMLGVIGTVGALGYAFGELVLHIIDTEHALADLQSVAAARGLDTTRTQFEGLLDTIKSSAGVTTDEGAKILFYFEHIKGASASTFSFLSDILPQMSVLLGEKPVAAAKTLADALNDPATKGEQLMRQLGANNDQINTFTEAMRNSAAAGYSVLAGYLVSAANRAHEAAGQITESEAAITTGLAGMAGIIAPDVGVQLKQLGDANETAKAAQANKDYAASVDSMTKGLTGVGKPLDMVRTDISAIGADLQKSHARILQEELDMWNKRIAVGDLAGKELESAETARNRVQVELARAVSSEIVGIRRTQIAAERAEGTKSQTQILQDEITGDKALLDNAQVTADDKKQIELRLNEATAQLVGLRNKTQLDSLEAITAATKNGTADRIAAVMDEVEYTSRVYGEGSAQNIAANRRLQQAIQAAADETVRLELKNYDTEVAGAAKASQERINIRKQELDYITNLGDRYQTQRAAVEQQYTTEVQSHSNEVKKIREDDMRTAVQLENLRITNQKAVLDQEAKSFEITNSEKFAALRNFEDASCNTQVAEYEREKALLAKGTADYARIKNQELILEQKHLNQITQLNIQAANAAEQSWLRILNPITQGFNATFIALNTSNQTFVQRVTSAWQGMVISILQSQLQIETKWLASQLAMALGANDFANKSLLAWVASELGITSTAHDETINRIADKGVEAATSIILAKGQAIAEIEGYAATGAAAAYASTAAIPIFGPELAPAAAATARKAIEANLVTIPGFAQGAFDLPSDMLAQVHKGEMIIPASFADSVRSTITSGGGGGDNYHINITAIDTQSAASFLKSNARSVVAALQSQVRNGNKSINLGSVV